MKIYDSFVAVVLTLVPLFIGACAPDSGSAQAQRDSASPDSSRPDFGLPMLARNDQKLIELRRAAHELDGLRAAEIKASSAGDISEPSATHGSGVSVWLLRSNELAPSKPPRLVTVLDETRELWGVRAKTVIFNIIEVSPEGDSPPSLSCSLGSVERSRLKGVYVSLARLEKFVGDVGFDASALSSRRDFFGWANSHVAKLCAAGGGESEARRLAEIMDDFRTQLREGKAVSEFGPLGAELLSDLKDATISWQPAFPYQPTGTLTARLP